MAAHMNTRTVDSQKQSSAKGVGWPVDHASLLALSDLGLTVAQIARYFSIDPVEVQALLNRH